MDRDKEKDTESPQHIDARIREHKTSAVRVAIVSMMGTRWGVGMPGYDMKKGECYFNGLTYRLAHLDSFNAVFEIFRTDQNDHQPVSSRYCNAFNALGLNYCGIQEFQGDLPHGGYGIDLTPPSQYPAGSAETEMVTVELKGLASALSLRTDLATDYHRMGIDAAMNFAHLQDAQGGRVREQAEKIYHDYLERRGEQAGRNRS